VLLAIDLLRDLELADMVRRCYVHR
jgi:hypothetical protein